MLYVFVQGILQQELSHLLVFVLGGQSHISNSVTLESRHRAAPPPIYICGVSSNNVWWATDCQINPHQA